MIRLATIDIRIAEKLLDDINVEVLQKAVERQRLRSRDDSLVVGSTPADARNASSELRIQVGNHEATNIPFLPASQWVEEAVNQE